MADPVLLSARDGAVVTLTLNRPDALNALSIELEAALKQAFRDVQGATDVRAVVLTGTGRAFSAGVDLKELEQTGTGARDWLGTDSLADIMRATDVPIIAAVNGFAITGGLELALLADFIIASEDARFADTHARVGLTPSWGMTQILPRRIGVARARQMSFTGGFVDAGQALAWGLVNEVIPREDLVARAGALAHEIAETDRVTMDRIRTLIADGENMPLDEAMTREAEVFAQHLHGVTTERLGENREAVLARGRAKTQPR